MLAGNLLDPQRGPERLCELPRIRSRRDELYDEAEQAMRSVTCSVLIVKDEDAVYDMYEALV